MDFMLYPTFEIVDNRGIIPSIRLPREYLEIIPKFYEQGRKEDVEEHTKSLQELSNTKIRLQWDEKKGLTNISIGTAGLDLNEYGWPSFQEHNLGGNYSLYTGSIAMKYISEMLKTVNS